MGDKIRNVYVVHTSPRDVRELRKIAHERDYRLYFQRYNASNILGPYDNMRLTHLMNPGYELDTIESFCRHHDIHAVVCSEDYPGSLYASLLASRLNLYGPPLKPMLSSQHKYLSRAIQKHAEPEVVPFFSLINSLTFDACTFQFPLFIKPVKSVCSMWAATIENASELEAFVRRYPYDTPYLAPMNWFLSDHMLHPYHANGLIAESILSGEQVTLEGYVQHGDIVIFGVVDSIMYPNTISFSRFEYPSRLPLSVQEGMGNIAKSLVRAFKLDNTMFNIEFMFNRYTNEIHVIEINPRIASQFADLYEKVDGFNSYQVLLDIALGDEVKLNYRQGPYARAASFVLRHFNKDHPLLFPSNAALRRVQREYPDARVELTIRPDHNPTHTFQDCDSLRYCILNLGADTDEQLWDRYEHIKEMLYGKAL